MKSWKMRGAAALAILSLAIAGCQPQQGDDSESVDTLPSVEESMDMESMDMESMDDGESSDDADESDDADDDASPSEDS